MDQPRLSPAQPPRALLVQVSGPGSLVFYDGAQRVLTLQRGRIEGHGFVSFPQAWAEGRFIENRALAGDALPNPTLKHEQQDLLVRLTLQLQRRALHGGTRHRAAYRLCLAAPECLTIVVSQDGSVQFVHEQAGQIIVWDQLTY